MLASPQVYLFVKYQEVQNSFRSMSTTHLQMLKYLDFKISYAIELCVVERDDNNVYPYNFLLSLD